MGPANRCLIAVALSAAAATGAHAAADDLPPVQGFAFGDFDGDGKTDFAVGLPEVNAGKVKKSGELRIYGSDGTFLRKRGGVSPEQSYAVSLAAVGDVDQDGATDLVAVAPFGEGDPYFEVLSGKTLRVLDTRHGRGMIQWGDEACAAGDGSGKARVDVLVRSVNEKLWRVHMLDRAGASGGTLPDDSGYVAEAVAAGDVDGDRIPDIALAHRWADSSGKESAGRVQVVAGELLRRGHAEQYVLTLTGAAAQEMLGSSVAAAGDWDGDGKGDLLVSSAGDEKKKTAGLVRVFSGKDGTELWRASGAAGDWHAPETVLVGDADGDGKPDVAVATASAGAKAGVVTVHAAKDAAQLWTVKGAAREMLGEELFPFRDADADGVADLVVVAPGAAAGGKRGAGYVRVLSGKTGASLLLVNPLAAK